MAQVRALARAALSAGGSVEGATRVGWRIGGRCIAPVTVERFARPHAADKNSRVVEVPTDGTPNLVTLEVPCRKCLPCRKARARVWADRARSETRAAPRTWFVTLTFSPQERVRVLSAARKRARERSEEDFERLSEVERFGRLHDAAGPLVTRYLKRVRKAANVPLRFIAVAEGHQDGFPHYHLLVHEVLPGMHVKERQLREQWRGWHGFAEAKLVDGTKAASGYVTKYLTKSSLARVRASIRYGETGLMPIVAPMGAT